MKPNLAVKELRRLIGTTQGEFAEMIGASKDTVASWEIGRNKLSPQFARRIAFATGVDGEWLMKGKPEYLLYQDPLMESAKTYRAEHYEAYRKLMRGRSDEAEAKYHLKQCGQTLELIFMAAAMRVEEGKMKYGLPGVLESFVRWCEKVREDFGLEEAIEERLRARGFEEWVTMTYKEWRELARKGSDLPRAAGFVDNRQRAGDESETLKVWMHPGWAPGRNMQPGQAAVKVASRRTEENLKAET